MNTIQLIDYAELALAGYGQFDVSGRPPLATELTTLNGDPAGFATSQANRFRQRFALGTPTFNDAKSTGGSSETSFDATVFRSLLPADQGKVYISLRGVQQQLSAGTPNDIQAVSDIVANGAAFGQIVQMYNWWQRVNTPVNIQGAPQFVAQYMLAPDGRGVARTANVASTGEVAALLAATPGAKVTVTGSSLGGHLAMAFAGLFPSATEGAFAFNAPGFANDTYVRTLFSALGGSVPTSGNPLITNLVSSEANNAGARLDLIAGFPGNSYPGLQLIVPIEDQFIGDVGTDAKVPSWNHDQRQVTDSLSVFNLLQQLDNSLTLERFGSFVRAAAIGEKRSLENLVDAVEVVLGINTTQLPAGNSQRNALHEALQAIVGGAPQSPQPNAVYQTLAGNIRLEPVPADLASKARSDFQSVVALQALSPFVLQPTGAVGQAALDSLWQSATWGTQYLDWLADYAARQAGGVGVNFSDTYLDDRQALLQNLLAAGVQNARTNPDGYVAVQGSTGGTSNTRYVDAAGALVQVNHVRISPSTAPNRLVVFGSRFGDGINGSTEGDHLYGGAGNDTLDGLSGDDYLEGGKDYDTYQFGAGFGQDTILDSDGLGQIRVGAVVLRGGVQTVGGARTWQSADQQYRYTVLPQGNTGLTLTLSLSQSQSQSAETKTGRRRVIEYLLSPIQKAGSESLRER